jgi:hypothetical protein
LHFTPASSRRDDKNRKMNKETAKRLNGNITAKTEFQGEVCMVYEDKRDGEGSPDIEMLSFQQQL